MCPKTSEPTDLIRAVDKHQACCRNAARNCACLECGEHWPCEVRRLRDALEASEAELAENEAFINVWRNRTYRAEAALAEANATIERVEALTYRSDDGTEWTHLHPDDEGEPECAACWAQSIRRALKGEKS